MRPGGQPIRLLTNNPKKIVGLEGYGLAVVDRVPIEMPPDGDNADYLRTKRDKMGHILHHQDLRFDADGQQEPLDPGPVEGWDGSRIAWQFPAASHRDTASSTPTIFPILREICVLVSREIRSGTAYELSDSGH